MKEGQIAPFCQGMPIFLSVPSGTVQIMRDALNARGCVVERIRQSIRPCIMVADEVTRIRLEIQQFHLKFGDASIGFRQLVRHRDCRHNGQTLITDLTEVFLQAFDSLVDLARKPLQVGFLSLAASHAVNTASNRNGYLPHGTPLSSALNKPDMRQYGPQCRAGLLKAPSNFVVCQFQGFRTRHCGIEFDAEAGSIVLQHGKFLVDIASFGLRFETPLACSVEPVERGGKPI
jgi:hypothetical protein